MAPKFFAYLHAKYFTQNKHDFSHKKSSFTVGGLILMKFWHQILWPQTVLTVPSIHRGTQIWPSYKVKRVLKTRAFSALLEPFSRTFTQQKSKKWSEN